MINHPSIDDLFIHPFPSSPALRSCAQTEAADLRRQVEDLTRRNEELTKQLTKQQQAAAAAVAGEGGK